MRLTTEQVELQDLVRRFLAERITSEYLQGRLNASTDFDQGFAQSLSELGLYDTFSGDVPACGVVELALVAEECGRALAPDSPVERVLTTALSQSLLSAADKALFASVIAPAGDAVALAFSRCCDFTVDPKSNLISGSVDWAVGRAEAKVLLGFAATANGQQMFLAPLAVPHIGRSVLPSLDHTIALQRFSLTNANCSVLSPESSEAIAVAIDILKASEISGLCQRVLEMTTEYVKTRKQFGAAIGSFQAVQQKLAQIYAETEALTSLCRFAAWSFNASPQQRALTAQAAALKAADVGPIVCEVAIQCHGGIGFTWEYDLHMFLRRAKSIQAAFRMNEDSADRLIVAAR